MLRPLQIGWTDVVGRRFNGQDLHLELFKRGYGSHHLVWKKEGKDENTSEIADRFRRWNVDRVINEAERNLSVQTLLHPTPFLLPFNEQFKEANLVHYHLIHVRFFSLAGLPLLTRLKPSLWTLHDPWAITGRCIYPITCERWKHGCGACPDMNDVMSPMQHDNTRLMWQLKKYFYAKSDIDIIVASKWMQRMVRESPLTSKSRVHYIPFGVDLNMFKPADDVMAKKKKLGIMPGNTVICLRATPSPFKGLNHVIEALEILGTDRSLTILTFEGKELFKKYLGKHQLIDLGWVDDQQQISEAYQCADFFLMPSVAEAFGLMAIEAMASGKPTIVFEGTSLPEVTFAPEGGMAVPMRDSRALAAAMISLIDNESMRKSIGAKARQLAEQYYDWNTHVDNMLELYNEVTQRALAHGRSQIQVPEL